MPKAWNRLPVEQRPPGFHPLHGISEESSIDGGQRSIYGLSKLIGDAACQEYAQAFDLPIAVNRFGAISGPGMGGFVGYGANSMTNEGKCLTRVFLERGYLRFEHTYAKLTQ